MVIGAGGAARGIIYALSLEGPDRICVANRTADKAEAVAAEWKDLADIRGISMEQLPAYLRDADILINTTSVGMHPNVSDTPAEADLVPDGIVVSDLIYNPLKTRLLAEAEQKAAPCTAGSACSSIRARTRSNTGPGRLPGGRDAKRGAEEYVGIDPFRGTIEVQSNIKEL